MSSDPVVSVPTSAPIAAAGRLPWEALLILAGGGFVTILTEALPAGLLPQIGEAFGVSEALAGQWISAYAMGSLAAAIPITAATRHWQRRSLLLVAMTGFALANLVTAMTGHFLFSLIARFIGGVSAGLLWALVAGYAIRLSPEHLAGRAMAIAMAGTPVALSIGIPAGTWLGQLAGWRTPFIVLTVMAISLLAWIRLRLPDLAGEETADRLPLTKVLVLPGIRAVLMLTCAMVLAHNILYTYISPLLDRAGMPGRTDHVLLVFGLAGLAGIAAAGALIDRHLHRLNTGTIALFLLASLLLGLSRSTYAIYCAVVMWGVAFGAAPTLLQTILAKAAGSTADVAQAMFVSSWNLAIASGAMTGGVLLARHGPGALPWAAIMLLILASACLRTSKAR